MYISLWENYRGHPDNISFMQFSTKIDGFEQKDSQGFENSYNSYEQYPLEKFFIFTIYQNYTLALMVKTLKTTVKMNAHGTPNGGSNIQHKCCQYPHYTETFNVGHISKGQIILPAWVNLVTGTCL